MKKIMAILAVAIMLLSIVPSAFGQIDVNVKADANAEVDTDTSLDTDVKTQLNIKAKKEAFMNAMEAKAKARAQMKAKLETARDEWRQAKQDGLSEQEKFERAQKFMLTVVDKMIANQEHLIAKVEANGDLRPDLIGKLKLRLDFYTELREQIENAENFKELQASAKKLKLEWAMSRKEAKAHISTLVNAKLEKAISILEKSAARIDAKLETYAEEGKDVEVQEKLLTEAYSKIESAKRNLDASAETSASISSSASVEESQKAFAKSKTFIKLANRDLSDARIKLKKILVSLNAEGELNE